MAKLSLVSVIIPVYNSEKYVSESIRSVLSQTYTDYEIIIVNDGSTDDSTSIIKGFGSRVKVLEQPNLGAAAARNLGVKRSEGEFLAFLDSDDLWVEQKLEWQVSSLLEEPDIDMSFGYFESFISPDLDEGAKNGLHCPTQKMSGYIPSAMVVKRDSFNKVGPFDAKWKIGEFLDWYAKAKFLGLKAKTIPQTVLKRRIHKTNLGIQEKDSRLDYVRILKDSIACRKKSEKI